MSYVAHGQAPKKSGKTCGHEVHGDWRREMVTAAIICTSLLPLSVGTQQMSIDSEVGICFSTHPLPIMRRRSWPVRPSAPRLSRLRHFTPRAQRKSESDLHFDLTVRSLYGLYTLHFGLKWRSSCVLRKEIHLWDLFPIRPVLPVRRGHGRSSLSQRYQRWQVPCNQPGIVKRSALMIAC